MGEIWKPVVGYEDLYAVSDKGNIVRTKKYLNSSDGPLKQSHCSGYLNVSLSKGNKPRSFLVHRVVADAFIGIPSDMVVNHKNGDKLDNRLENLEVVTRQENERHKWSVLGTGARNNIKLTEQDVRLIRSIYKKEGHSLKTLATRFGVTKSNISHIVNRKTWTHI